ncbi:HU family DNA-binding protein [Spiroplasma tabanidicola]|uniref:DNA-binding protein HU-beta n=1 Tax=Spiroplasma tabanidicola TaxID=324079 RepID=A0A6I6C9Y7_9MOLU|nr:HU family DNA-binding protein [Spiroplasma tabanidicola]QGS51721.1 DNA-binding protein HU-beta [Spiroplasma tabanidicola]
MTKKELSDKLASEFNHSKADGEKMVNFIFDSITSSLIKGEEVAIAGFGKFATADRAAREGVNPSTGEKIKIEATTVAKFKVAKQLKEAVAKK